MFIRQTIIHTAIDKIDEAAKLFEESVIPAFQAQKGYQGASFISDRTTGKSICVSLWDSEQDAIANDALLNVAALVAMKDYPDKQHIPLFYAESNSLVRFLRHRYGVRDSFAILRLLATRPVDQALQQGTNYQSAVELQRAWLKWVNRNDA